MTFSHATALEEALARQRQLTEELRTVVDHMPHGLLVLEPGGVVRHINAAAARMLKLPRHLAMGRPLGALVDFDPLVAQVFHTGEGYTDRERTISTPTLQLQVLDTAVPVKAEDGRVLSVVNTFREIEAVRRLAGRIAGNHARYTFDSIVGRSPVLREVIAAAQKAAQGSASILLLGESGTGKEVFAQAIHNASARSDGPFIAINCAALPRDLIESELFGHAPGAFTGARREGSPGKFEAASGGTLFLDELSELPLDIQAKLLRVLQEREVVRLGETQARPLDVRIIAASNRDLLAMVERREFRPDLYYRSHAIALTLPPLRARTQDIALLAQYFLDRHYARLGRPAQALPPDLLAHLMRYDWPGNVRELENALDRLVHLSDGSRLEAQTLSWLAPSAARAGAAHGDAAGPRARSLREMEVEAITQALRQHQYNVTRAAQALGIAKPTLYARLRRHGIALQRPLAPQGPRG